MIFGKPKNDAKLCPAFKSPCIQHKCVKYIQVRGNHPQTGAEIDQWDCADVWIPILLINTAKEVRQGAAATESFRNEMVKESALSRQTQIAIARHKSGDSHLTIELKDQKA